MSFNISVSIPSDQFDGFREHYDADTIEEAAEEFKTEVIEKRDSIGETGE